MNIVKNNLRIEKCVKKDNFIRALASAKIHSGSLNNWDYKNAKMVRN